jgi:hypothetical protein
MQRFLRYSLEKQRKIRAVLMIDGMISQLNLLVTALSDTEVSFISAKHKSGITLPLEAILSADYLKSDKAED